MKYKTFIILACLGLTVASVNAGASELLKYNPFEQPDKSAERSQAGLNKVSRNKMKLRATLIDGADSLVNIDGQYLRLNQQVAGYRVVQIKNSSVTLLRGANEMVLTLNADE